MSSKITKLKQFVELKEQLGIDLPEVKTVPSQAGRAQQARLLTFARDNNFIITPVGYQYYVDSFNQFHACPCDISRKDCPCEQACGEILTKGSCLCKLFWRDYGTYMDTIFKEQK
jgi:hypothetical protein